MLSIILSLNSWSDILKYVTILTRIKNIIATIADIVIITFTCFWSGVFSSGASATSILILPYSVCNPILSTNMYALPWCN